MVTEWRLKNKRLELQQKLEAKLHDVEVRFYERVEHVYFLKLLHLKKSKKCKRRRRIWQLKQPQP